MAVPTPRNVVGRGAARSPWLVARVREETPAGEPRSLIVVPANRVTYGILTLLVLIVVLLTVLATAALIPSGSSKAVDLDAQVAASPTASQTTPSGYPSPPVPTEHETPTGSSTASPSLPAATTPAAVGAQAGGYRVLFGPENLRVPRADTGPGDCPDTVVDIDGFTVVPVARIDDGTDLVYGECFAAELRRVSAFAGLAPPEQPAPEACEATARSKPFSFLRAEDMTVKEMALCVITSEGNVAWMLLVRKDGEDLLFRTTVWEPPSGPEE